MKYGDQLEPIVDSIFRKAESIIKNEKTPFNGNFERLNQRKEYMERFTNWRKKHDIPNKVIIEDPLINNLYKNISHISMGPKKKIYFEKFYDLSERADNELMKHGIIYCLESKESPINYSKERVQQFFNLITEKAHEITNVKPQTDYDYCKYNIIGPPGIGKTAFINYLFSINHDLLDKKKIIFVRVDLNDVTMLKLSLEERFCSKWMRIFAKYYFKNIIDAHKFELDFRDFFVSSFFNYSFFDRQSENKKHSIFDHYINSLHEIHPLSFNEFEFSIRSLETYDRDNNVIISSKDLCLMTKLVISFLQKRDKWGYIIVFDGFDGVTFDQIQFEEYARWIDYIKLITTVKDNPLYKSIYIITMRDYSYLRVYHDRKQHEDSDTAKGLPDFKTLEIGQINFSRVINKRFEYIKMLLSYEKYNELKHNLIYLMFMCFKQIDPYTAVNTEWDNIIQDISHVISNNYRLFFRFLRDLLSLTYSLFEDKASQLLASVPETFDYLKQFRGLEWQVIRLLIYGTTNLQPFVNRTKYEMNGQPVFMRVNPVIPNIFNFNEYSYFTPEAEEGKTALDFGNKVLVKYRMVQNIRDHGGTNGILNVFNWIKNNFHDQWGEELRYESRELIFSNILKCDIEEIDIDKQEYIRTNYLLHTTPKSNVIDYMLDSSIYYETIMDNTPIERRFSKYLNPLHRIERLDTWDYLKEKTLNIAIFISYLMYVENSEIQRFLNKESYRTKFHIFDRKRIYKIKQDIIRYLNGYLEDLQEEQTYQEIAGLIKIAKIE
jgi:hypothetical protein